MQIGLQVETFNILNELIRQFAQFAPNIFGALLIILVGFIIVRVLSRVVRKVLEKVGIDKLADNSINKIDVLSTNNIALKPSKLIAQIVYYFALLVVLVAATDVLKMEAVSNLVKEAVNYVPSLVTAMMLLAIGLIIADFVQDVSLAALQSLNVPAAKFVSGFIFYFILLNVLMLALEQAKINTDFITANLSIILAGIVLAFSIGYGLASKAIMSNHIAYFYNRKKIGIGDTITLNHKKEQ
ncbi:MAG: hypothetical protein HC912_04030 [Saprospiraceae bacterium]|nr:hypothetical protein [Saprospiraceae bacterium]